MLVKRSIVERWYRTDSWVYKNFAFLLKNPLWVKPVPQGFSVCPYFWLNLFSFLIFRPFFVAPIHYVFKPIIKACGKPAAAVDSFLYEMLRKVKMAPRTPSPGQGIGITFALTILAAFAAYCFYWAGVGLKDFYPYLTENSRTGLFAFWSVSSFAALFAVIGIHKGITKTECKTMNYLYVWLVLLIIALWVFIPAETWYVVKDIFALIGWALGGIWSGICWLFSFLGKWLWVGVKWAPIEAFYVPWWIYLLLLGALGYLSSNIFGFLDNSEFEDFGEESDGEDRLRRNREAWISVFARVLCGHEYWRTGEYFAESYSLYAYSHGNPSEHLTKALIASRNEVYRSALETMFVEQLNVLQEKFPFLNRMKLYEIYDLSSSSDRFEALEAEIGVHLNFDNSNFAQTIERVLKSDVLLRQQIDGIVDHYEEMDADLESKKLARKNSWTHRMCILVTTKIGNGFGRAGALVKWIWLNIHTLASYLWMLVKAKKQGACPYIRFTEANTKKK